MKFFEINQDAFAQFLSTQEKKHKYKWENDNGNGNGFSMIYNQRHLPVIENGIGYVHVYGTLLTDATDYDKMTGNTDYNDIMEELEELVEQGVKAIVLVINSGGGTVQGSYECANYIKNLPVPTIASVEGYATSAAYKLAASCTHIHATETSIVGNIGTIMTYADQSAQYQAAGLNMLTFVNDGAIYKSIGHGDTSLTEEQMSYLQEQINTAGTKFQDYIKRARPEVSEDCFTAAWYSGEQAVDKGLVDMIATDEDIEEMMLMLIGE